MLYGIGMVLTFIGFAMFTLSAYLKDLNNSQKYGTEEPSVFPSILLMITYGFVGTLLWPLALVLILFNKDSILKMIDDSDSEAKNFARSKELIDTLNREQERKEIKKEIKDENQKKNKNSAPKKHEPSSLITPDIDIPNVNWDEYNEEFDKAIEYLNHKDKNPDNIAWGVKQIMRLAEMGMPKAQYKLGMLYCMGNGVDRDMDKYFFWMEKCESIYGSAKNPKYMEDFKRSFNDPQV